MRKLLTAIALLGGLASIALCGSYGWDQATVLKDQVTQAFIFAMVAVFTLVLHVAAIRTWVLGWRKSGAAIGFAAFLAFVMTAFTSLGGLASRSDRVIAERQDVLDTKADTKQQIADLTKERAALKFTRITKGAVDAAQQVADAAKLTKERECGGGDPRQRGRFCRDKEDGEGVALASLATATTNKAATDRFDEIEAQLKKLRSLKGETGVGSVNPLRDLLATIMGAWADLLTAWQKAVFAVIYDICLIAAMVGIEVLDHATPFARTRETPEMEPVHATTQAEVQPPRVPERLRPKLASTTRQPVGALLEFLNGGVDIVDRGRTEMTDAYLSYSTWCKSQGLRPMEVEDFFFGMQKLCRKFGIRIQEQGDGHYLLNVQLKNVWVTA